MNRRKWIALRVCAGLFVVYSAWMIWLLFFRNRGIHGEAPAFNLIPLRTIEQMLLLLHAEETAWFALRNLVGNVVLFAPFGCFLPVLWKRQRRFVFFLVTVAAGIAVIELLQAAMAVGVCDIDDWLCNIFGASLGFCVWNIVKRRLSDSTE